MKQTEGRQIADKAANRQPLTLDLCYDNPAGSALSNLLHRQAGGYVGSSDA